MNEEPEFEIGRAYLVKALDHFTRYKSEDEKVYLKFLGIFHGETDDYYQFLTFYYEDYTSKDQFYTPEVRHLVKGTLVEVQPLNLYVEKEIKIKNDMGVDPITNVVK